LLGNFISKCFQFIQNLVRSLFFAHQRKFFRALFCDHGNDIRIHTEAGTCGFQRVCANSLKTAGAGFGVDTNIITMITKQGAEELPLMSKEQAAHQILNKLKTL